MLRICSIYFSVISDFTSCVWKRFAEESFLSLVSIMAPRGWLTGTLTLLISDVLHPRTLIRNQLIYLRKKKITFCKICFDALLLQTFATLFLYLRFGSSGLCYWTRQTANQSQSLALTSLNQKQLEASTAPPAGFTALLLLTTTGPAGPAGSQFVLIHNAKLPHLEATP